MTRTNEQGHTKKCLARTMISVIENMRDDTNYTDVGFAIDAQTPGYVYNLAFEYLNDGIAECHCPDLAECPNGHGMQEVTESSSNPGFTGAPIYFWRLACGCQDQDLSEDNLDAAR